MRITLVFLLTTLFFTTKAQKIEYLHDSLFVNNLFVDAQTSKSTLDSILNLKSKTKKSKDDFRKDPKTLKKVILTTYFYDELGLFFRKYDYDTSKLSVGIKLYCDTDRKQDKKSELKGTFKGQLYIAENLINDKRRIEQLNSLKNCRVTVSQLSFGTYSSILGGDIIYGLNIIRLAFDKTTEELKEVFIHHNFKER